MCSSDLSTIQTLQPPPPPNMLKSEFLHAELLAITSEVQRLVKHRRSPTLHLDYQEQWDSLQTRASNLLNFLSQKCNKIHEAAAMHILSLVHSVEEDQDNMLLSDSRGVRAYKLQTLSLQTSEPQSQLVN